MEREFWDSEQIYHFMNKFKRLICYIFLRKKKFSHFVYLTLSSSEQFVGIDFSRLRVKNIK